MVLKRRGNRRPIKREKLELDRRNERTRRLRAVVRDAIRLRRFSPSRTIGMMMDLSDICVELGRGTRHE
jgi:hypothetical protein